MSYYVKAISPKYKDARSVHRTAHGFNVTHYNRHAGYEKIAYGPFATEEDARAWNDLKGARGEITTDPSGVRFIRVSTNDKDRFEGSRP
jgi:hypothetical protein